MDSQNLALVFEQIITFNYLNPSIPIFILLLLIEFYYSKMHQKKLFRINDTVSSLSAGILQQLSGILFVNSILIFTYTSTQKIYTLIDFDSLSLSLKFPMALALVLLVDFFYYLFHYSSHRINLLWAAHIVHHQSEEYNLSTALRQSALQACFSWIFYLPIALLGFPVKWFIAIKSLNLIYQFWIHTEIISKLHPIIEYLFNTPSHHRVHHGRNHKYLDKNHAGMLIIWDKMFGTFQKEEEHPSYGITTGLNSWNPLWAQCHYFVYLFKISCLTPSYLEKIKIWIKPPEWKPVALKKDLSEELQDLSKKYDPFVHKKDILFALVMFSISFIFIFVALFATENFLYTSLLAIFITFMLFLSGRSLEGKDYLFRTKKKRESSIKI